MAKLKNEAGEELELDQILEDSEYQAAFDKKIQKALEKNKADTDAEVQKKLDAALATREETIRQNIQQEIEAKQKEAEELAKLSEAEKFQKQIDAISQENAAMKNQIAIANREKKIKAYIKEKGYDTEAILEFVDPANVTDTNFEERVDAVNNTLNDKISKAVAAKLKDGGEKVLGGKGGGNGEPGFDFNFQAIKAPASK